MNPKIIEARENVIKAREALRRGDKASARRLGEQAVLLAPEMEDVWLVLAASDPNPQDALAYAQKALAINPQSTRAHQAVEWTSRQLKQARASNLLVSVQEKSGVLSVSKDRSDAVVADTPKRVYREAVPIPVLKRTGTNWLYPAVLIGAGCVIFALASLFALTRPAAASFINNIGAPAFEQENNWASVDIPKPTVTPIGVNAFAVQAADTPVATSAAALPPLSASPVPTDEPTSIPTEAPIATQTPAATETPGSMVMEIIADTPTSQYAAQGSYPAKGNGARWIDVDLSQQRVYAYEGDIIVNSFIVSTGTSRTPTVTGKYKIWIKLKSTTMSGPGYHLTNVPYTMYFYKGYGLHGTYWHNNFGTPMSHGCVNLSIPDAQWLYNWAFEGTTVNVHY
ncbi:MAG: L,D-transpeptidase family protein [Anaerolineae bacterium]|nr:L,D-transpeptidase family protein [Anaerolineae bacterium]MCI0609506.1 L,D-transpeptidase family protein [Anaerolineae bacterium]